jgi:peptidylprolyl isomerase
MPAPSLVTLGLVGFLALGLGASALVTASQENPTCDTVTGVTTAASLVEATDIIGQAGPEIFFPTPLKTTGTERLTTREGSGLEAADGSAVDFHVTIMFGPTGEFIDSSWPDAETPARRVVDSESTDFFSRELRCSKPGERIVFTSPVVEVFGPIEENEIVTNDSTVVLVVDVQRTFLATPDGSSALAARGLPQVVDHPDGFHGVSFPMSPPPAKLSVQTVISGSGEPIADGDRVVAHYTGVVWETQSVFSSSFDQNFPVTLVASDASAEGATTGVIRGVYDSLIGQTVGSRVLAVIPPEVGYPAGQAPQGVPDGATLVYVFDILGIE